MSYRGDFFGKKAKNYQFSHQNDVVKVLKCNFVKINFIFLYCPYKMPYLFILMCYPNINISVFRDKKLKKGQIR